jgi:hypothetical protein
MTRRALLLAAILLLAPVLRLAPPAPLAQPATTGRLPTRLTGAEFFTLSTELSEPDGYFRSENLVSNEQFMQRVIPELTRTVKPGRAYLGVGPEQNFTYIAATRPAMAFIIDVRRGNLQLHLLYKALFALSADRADFVSRLFSLRRPAGLTRTSTVQDIFTAYAEPKLRSQDLFRQNLAAIKRFYVRLNAPGLGQSDAGGVEEIYQTFYDRGLDIHYEVMPGSAGAFPTYAEVMTATDGSVPRSYLASEETFALVKDLHARNLVVPVIGNFAGPKAIRAVGKYLKSRGAVVGAFYVSNVEQYLMREGGLEEFCASASTLPLDDTSTFVRSERGGVQPRFGRSQQTGRGFGGGFSSKLSNILTDLKGCTR